MVKVNGYSAIYTVDGIRVSYNLSELSDFGDVVRSNIRKSTSIKATDTEVLKAIETINNFLLERESVT